MLPGVPAHDRPPEQLVAANGRLQATYSAARVGGPGVGGLLVQALSAPVALLVDALSFLVSAVGLSSIEAEERVRSKEERAGRVWTSITEGLRYSFGQPLLRAVTIQATCWNLFIASIQAVYIMYATRQLGLSPALIGLTSAGGAVGSLIASFTTRRMALRFGTGRTIAGAVVLGCSAPLLLPLAGGPTALVIAVIALSFFLSGVGATTSNVHVVALRQTITPQDLIGRATASHRFCAGSALPLGALLGGVMGEVLGLREALFVSAAALFCTPVLILTSPIPGLRELPKGPMK
ncbi:MFS transporter [Streptomyces sudanensis]|uniref:MFS transporter n=1 Tax=Streptomyces sudanensis TaxID=436397 RepID=UPI0020CF387F|nr:MFS transporter [Streptomyces sudanensis]MCP9988929.1 MFS transporter [Streptomyces sudanensis]